VREGGREGGKERRGGCSCKCVCICVLGSGSDKKRRMNDIGQTTIAPRVARCADSAFFIAVLFIVGTMARPVGEGFPAVFFLLIHQVAGVAMSCMVLQKHTHITS